MDDQEFDKVRTYEPMVVRQGMTATEDMSVRITMNIATKLNGAVIMTKDYVKLLDAYNQLKADAKLSTKPLPNPPPKK